MKVGLIGTGLMGKPMARKIKEAGFDLRVYNRTKEKAVDLKKEGVEVENSVQKLLEESDTVILILSDYNAIVSLLFEDEISFQGKTIIQMSTIAPKESLLLKDRIENLNGVYFEAPVLGSIPQIENKELITLIGDTRQNYKNYQNLFESFSNKIVYIGETGKAAAIKLALNQLIASETAIFSMSLGYLREKDVDIEKFMDILRGSALYAPTFDKKLDNYVERNFDNPNFPLKHLLKDIKLMINDFDAEGINIKPLDAVKEIVKEGVETKLADKDYSALYNIVHPKREK